MTTLSQEASVLEDYINLQNYKQFGAIQYHITIESGIENCLVPKFILQPLAENSIVHGFNGDFTDAYIFIKAVRAGKDVRITVTDNGKGMPQGESEVLLDLARLDTNDNHIGLWNVHQRIQLMFGKKYGISFNSSEGLFFEAEMVIPYREETEDD